MRLAGLRSQAGFMFVLIRSHHLRKSGILDSPVRQIGFFRIFGIHPECASTTGIDPGIQKLMGGGLRVKRAPMNRRRALNNRPLVLKFTKNPGGPGPSLSGRDFSNLLIDASRVDIYPITLLNPILYCQRGQTKRPACGCDVNPRKRVLAMLFQIDRHSTANREPQNGNDGDVTRPILKTHYDRFTIGCVRNLFNTPPRID